MLLIQSVWMQGETFLQNVKVIKLCWEWQFHWFWLLVSVESSLLSFGRDLNTDVLTLHALLHFTQLLPTALGVADSIGFLHKYVLKWKNTSWNETIIKNWFKGWEGQDWNEKANFAGMNLSDHSLCHNIRLILHCTGLTGDLLVRMGSGKWRGGWGAGQAGRWDWSLYLSWYLSLYLSWYFYLYFHYW